MNPSVYPALLNYRDTGGRRALFAKNTVAYSDKPISTVKAGGPMELTSGGIVLHPGRYTYSDVMTDQNPKVGQFKIWLDAAIRDKKVQVLRTQVSEGLLSGPMVFNASEARYISPPYYMDYELLVAVDTVWSDSLLGNPTWIPGTVDVKSYWGKPTPPAGPDFDALRRAGAGLLHFGEGLATLAAILGLGYVLMVVANASKPSPARARA